MTDDELLAMAKQAGIRLSMNTHAHLIRFIRAIEARAAQEEREACAEMCDDMVLYTGYDCSAAIRARGSQP